MADEIKAGAETSEHATKNSASLWGMVAMVLGVVITACGVFSQSEGKIGIIAGAVLSVAGVLQKTLGDLGYIKSRTDVKVAASNLEAAKAQALGEK